MIGSKRIRLMEKKQYFESTWKTDNTSAGSSNNNQVKLPLESTGTYNCIVYWGDGTSDYITAYDQAEVTHTYNSIGTYQIYIEGQCEGFRFNNTGDKLKLLDISKWGNEDFRFGNTGHVFHGCSNLDITATDDTLYTITQDLTNMDTFFANCSNLSSIDLTNFNTSNVTTMSLAFYGCSKFNRSVSNFNTSNVTNMMYMFYNCIIFNQSISNFDTSNVTSMNRMFYNCQMFNQSVSNFNTSNVTDMNRMFHYCQIFDQLLSNFDTSEVTDMNNMFSNCQLFNQSLSNFDTNKVTDMGSMLYNCYAFNQDLSGFNIESVTDVTDILSGATSWSTANYDAFLIEIAANQNVVDGLTFTCSSYYTLGGDAAAARANLISTDNWTINDLGGV